MSGLAQEQVQRISIVTLFPEMFSGYLSLGVVGRAIRSGLLQVDFYNPRDFTHDRHRTVDDRPYGGGPGMLMMVQPLADAITAAKAAAAEQHTVVYLSPQGSTLNHASVVEFSQQGHLILVAGRYEGIDERIIERYIDVEVSIGDYVLSGGELPALVMVDAIARLVPGVLGHADSATEDSFSDGLLDCPHYTRPEILDGAAVPAVLLSGNHEKIRQWRLAQSLLRTKQRRPDLLNKLALTEEQRKILAHIERDALQQDDS